VGLGEGTPPPAIANFKAAFSDFGEKSLKFSPTLGENTLQHVFFALSPIFQNTPLLRLPLRAAPEQKSKRLREILI